MKKRWDIVPISIEKQESLNSIPVDQIYLEYVENKIGGLKIDLDSMQDLKPVEADQIIQRKKDAFLKNTERWEKIAEITNNFFFNFPGGWYRDLAKKKNNIKIKKKFQDIDEIINERGYSKEEIDLIEDQFLDKEKNERRWEIIMEVYLAMLDKGYEPKELWS